MTEQFCLLDVYKVALADHKSAAKLSRTVREGLHELQEHFTSLPSVSACSREIIMDSQWTLSRITTRPCRSPHACAHCTPIRQAQERAKINDWLNDRSVQGCQTFRCDLSVGFTPDTSLELRYSQLLRIWSLLTQSSLFRGLKKSHDLQFVRVLEETYSSFGWRPHIHALFTLKHDSSEDSIVKLIEKWVQLARGEGLQCFAHHQSFDEIDTEGHSAVSKYLTKHGRVSFQIDFLKWSPDVGSVSPLELLQAAAAQGSHDLLEALYEFEQASFRKRRVSWSSEARSTHNK